MAELADALDLGSSTFGVQVQLLSPAPLNIMKTSSEGCFFVILKNSFRLIKEFSYSYFVFILMDMINQRNKNVIVQNHLKLAVTIKIY